MSRRVVWPPKRVSRSGGAEFKVRLYSWDRANVETIARSVFGPDCKGWNLSEIVRRALERCARGIGKEPKD